MFEALSTAQLHGGVHGTAEENQDHPGTSCTYTTPRATGKCLNNKYSVGFRVIVVCFKEGKF